MRGRRMRVAAVDCGTNSLRLLVADLDPASGQAVEIERASEIVRLGEDVDRTGRFADAALQRTFGVLGQFAERISGLDVDRTRMVATSAARDVANRAEFVRGVQHHLGVTPDVISGDEEAQLTYDGVTRGLATAAGVVAPVLVLDIGGGSTEFVMRPSADGTAVGRSLDVGAVRLTERHLLDDPPTQRQVRAAQLDIDTALDTLELDADVNTLVGVAGTMLTMAAMVLRLPRYDRDAVHLVPLQTAALFAAVDEIVAMSVAQRRALPVMDPKRADVIAAGALLLARVVHRLEPSVVLSSSHDILDGVAWSMAGTGEP